MHFGLLFNHTELSICCILGTGSNITKVNVEWFLNLNKYLAFLKREMGSFHLEKSLKIDEFMYN